MSIRLNHPGSRGEADTVVGHTAGRWTGRGLLGGFLLVSMLAAPLAGTALAAPVVGPTSAAHGVAASAAPQVPDAIGAPRASILAPTTVNNTPKHTVGFNNLVTAEVYSGSTVYVGGQFSAAVSGGTSTPRTFLAAVNGATGALLPWAPKLNGVVTALLVKDDAVYIAGSFTKVNGQPRNHLAKVSRTTGVVDPNFNHSISSAPKALARGSSNLYVVGDFGTVDGHAWSRAVAFRLSSGQQVTGFHPALNGVVNAVAVSGSRVYLGGNFLQVNGAGGHARLAAVDASTGATVTGFQGGAPYVINDLEVGSAGVYGAMGGPGGQLVAYNTADGTPAWSLTADGDVEDVVVLHNAIYAGGHFDHACTTARVSQQNGDCLDGNLRRQKLFAADVAGHLLGWDPEANSIHGIFAMAANGDLDLLAVGGAFTTFGGNISQQRFAEFETG